jgi:DNA-directed RNA polymerase subunit RPC12/RpoP
MAGTLSITCPECKKTMQVPEVLAGKRIRCRGCSATLNVKKPVPQAAAIPFEKKPAANMDDEWAKAAAYGIETLDDQVRCAFCAADMDEGQVVCLKCGYNMQTREKHGVRILHEQTGGDYFLWHLPAAICVIVILACIGFGVIIWTETPDLGDIGEYIQKWRWGAVYTTGFLLAIIFYAGRFAVKRMIYNPHPPEYEKHAHDQHKDDDD